MKRSVVKKIMCFSLAFTMLASCLVGCGKEKKGNESGLLQESTASSKDYVFKSEDINISGANMDNVTSMQLIGDKIYLATYPDENGIAHIYSMNSDAGDFKDIKLDIGPSASFNYVTFDEDGNIYGIKDIYHYSDDDVMPNEDTTDTDDGASVENSDDAASEASSEGNMVTSSIEDSNESSSESSSESSDEEQSSEEGTEGMYKGEDADEEMYLVKLDKDGNELLSINLLKDLKNDEYMSVYSMCYISGSGLYVSSNRGIELFDGTAKFTKVIDSEDSSTDNYGSVMSIINGFNGNVFVSYYGGNGIELKPFDIKSGKLGEKSGAFTTNEYFQFFTGKGYDAYVSSDKAVYGYDKSNDKLIKIMDYIDSDLSVDYSISAIVALSDTEFLALLPDENYNYTLTRLTKVPADQVKDRKIITIGGSYIDYTVRQWATKFNKENDEYRIKLVDYSVYSTEDNWNAGYERFNMDIVSGSIPDIMIFSQEQPIESYISKGLFLDLNSYFNNDDELKNIDIVPNVKDMMIKNGKFYQIIPSFSISTIVTRKSYTQGKESLTVDDFEKLIDEVGAPYNTACGYLSKSGVLTYGVVLGGNNFIDWQNKKCNFNNDEFIKLLEFVNKFPDEINDELYDRDVDGLYQTNEALFMFRNIYEFRDYNVMKQAIFGDEVSFIGFPNDSGENYSVVVPEERICVSAHTAEPQACWDFVRKFLTKEYQDKVDYSFPVVRDSLMERGKRSMEKPYYDNDDGTKEYYDDYYPVNGEDIKLSPLTQDEVNTVIDYITSVDKELVYNENVSNIIMEEASAFFSGQKTAKEVADIIQSRLTIYVNENG